MYNYFLYAKKIYIFVKNKDMRTIDLIKIIDAQGLRIKDLGVILFPDTKYPYLAIRRIMKGKAFLSSNQIVLLSDHTGIPIEFLFNLGKWQFRLSENRIFAFSGEIKAELNTQTWETQLFKEDEKFLAPFVFAPTVSHGTYLAYITDLILKNK